MKHDRFFKVAFKASLNSQFRFKMGACLVKGGKVISTGYNQIRNIGFGTKYGYFEGSLHAEVDCLAGIDKTVSLGADMYVFRSFKNGFTAYAKPCSECMAFMSVMGIKRAFFSTEDGFDMIKL